MTKLPENEYGVSPSMKGSEPDDIFAFADHLSSKDVPLGPDGREALRMARAQQANVRAATTRMAIEIAMRELLEKKNAA